MSVILDALQKARTDRRKNQVEPHPNSVARVLEPEVHGSADMVALPRRKSWLVPVSLIFGLICLLALAGGAFFLLYDQVRQLNAPAKVTTPGVANVPASASAEAVNAELAVAAGAVPTPSATPVPLQDLPVQPPAAVAGPAAVAAPAGGVSIDVAPPGASSASASVPAAAPAASAALKLGSIVCEADDCIAHVNGRTVRVGDQIKNYTVTQITADSVTLQSAAANGAAGEVVTLSLFD